MSSKNWSLKKAFSELSVLVLGDIMLDAYLWGTSERQSPEAPVPILDVKNSSQRPGGAGNVAINARALGAKVDLISVLGDDENGRELNYILKSEDIDCSGVELIKGRMTTCKTRLISGNKHLIRVDQEQLDEVEIGQLDHLLSTLDKKLEKADVLILQDYDKGLFSVAFIGRVIALAHKHNVPVSVDPKKRHFMDYKGVDLFKPNLKEFEEGLEFKLIDFEPEVLYKQAERLSEQLNSKALLITLSEHGAMFFSKQNRGLIPAHPRHIEDVSGAGDTVITVASLALALGFSLSELTELANLAGGLVCEYTGVVPVPADRFFDEVSGLWPDKFH